MEGTVLIEIPIDLALKVSEYSKDKGWSTFHGAVYDLLRKAKCEVNKNGN